MDDRDLAALSDLQARLLSLKLLPRTGWLQRGQRDPESIAEHSYAVAALALLVGDMHPGLDRGRLLAIALLHDTAEALVGDLPASARRLFGAEAKQIAERKAMLELFGALPAGDDYLALWEEYVRGSSSEARLVKALDRLEMLAQALAYERAGSRAMGEFFEGGAAWADEFPIVRALAERVLAEHEALSRA